MPEARLRRDGPSGVQGQSPWPPEARLKAAGVDDPAREARRLVPLGEAAVARREAREPYAYIVGRQGFWTLDLAVSPATLIPRPDSETLIEAAVAALPDRGRVRRVLDLGTGSGCLLLAALVEFPAAFGVGVDRAAEAARVAAANGAANGLAGRAGFAVGDWAEPVAGRFDLVLCNPPYVESGAIGGLMPEVARYEPRGALDGGADGLDAYRRLLPGVPGLLAAGGVAVFELGQGQLAAVSSLAAGAGLAVAATHPDLSGIPRALVLRPPRQ